MTHPYGTDPRKIGCFIADAIITDADAAEFNGCERMVSRAIKAERRLIKRLAECLDCFYQPTERRDNPIMERTARALRDARKLGVRLVNSRG